TRLNSGLGALCYSASSARDRRDSECASNPALFAVPLQGTPDAFAQIDRRRVAELLTRARDIEGAALREEVDAAAVERRLETERGAGGFAGGAGEPERPHREVQRRRR